MKYEVNWLRDVIVNICEFRGFEYKTPKKKIKGNENMSLETESDGNSTSVIGDLIKKVHMGKISHLLVTLALKLFCPFPVILW
jgi:hypothetical protein